MPYLNYSLWAWVTKSNKIELLQKKAIGVLYSKSPIAHSAPLYIKMKQPKLSDLYTCNLLKLYHKFYRNRLPPYFDNFLPEFGEHNHMLRNDQIWPIQEISNFQTLKSPRTLWEHPFSVFLNI